MLNPSHAPVGGRLSGSEDAGRLSEALVANPLFGNDENLIQEVAQRLELVELGLDDILIGEGRGERDIFVIVTGVLSVQVAGREIAVRTKGSYVGEMSLVDPATRRSATVVARDKSVVGRIDEPSFTELADRFPSLWRNLAIDLVRRLLEEGEARA